MAELQYHGVIETEGGKESWAMLCMDSDTPDRALFSWQPTDSATLAAQVSVQHTGGGLDFQVLAIFQQYPNKVDLAELSADEQALASRLRMRLDRSEDGVLTGAWWDIGEQEKHDVKLMPASMITFRVDAVQCDTWQDFKSWAARVHDAGALAFRGQAKSAWALQTSLYRSGRANLLRYSVETLREFHGHLEAMTGLQVDADKPTEFGRMVAIAQHYGLPTPLLDWTLSPYIAAWFAFSDSLELRSVPLDDDSEFAKVRIYALAPAFAQAFPQQGIL